VYEDTLVPVTLPESCPREKIDVPRIVTIRAHSERARPQYQTENVASARLVAVEIGSMRSP
jgi:hypothetical protein